MICEVYIFLNHVLIMQTLPKLRLTAFVHRPDNLGKRYTPEKERQLLKIYNDRSKSLIDIANIMDKNPNSVVQKLYRMDSELPINKERLKDLNNQLQKEKSHAEKNRFR